VSGQCRTTHKVRPHRSLLQVQGCCGVTDLGWALLMPPAGVNISTIPKQQLDDGEVCAGAPFRHNISPYDC
jgi:hypothetical protein